MRFLLKPTMNLVERQQMMNSKLESWFYRSLWRNIVLHEEKVISTFTLFVKNTDIINVVLPSLLSMQSCCWLWFVCHSGCGWGDLCILGMFCHRWDFCVPQILVRNGFWKCAAHTSVNKHSHCISWSVHRWGILLCQLGRSSACVSQVSGRILRVFRETLRLPL
jgi:hypothetical protein